MNTENTGFSKGDFIMIDGLNAVVVSTDENDNIPKTMWRYFWERKETRGNPKEARKIRHR